MDKDFESELKGTANEASNAKQQIAKYFKRYGDSGQEECKKHQLMYASKIMCVITKCESKNLDTYCKIIVEIFADQLSPEASAKYWTLYVNCVRYFHYSLIEKKEFEKASTIYRHISAYKNKLQNAENGLTCINIYCYHLFLQNSLRSKNAELALNEATDVVENLTKLFNEILNTNASQNFQYPDVLQKSITWLFPSNKTGTVYQFLKTLPAEKVKQMFQALFTLYGRQKLDTSPNEVDVLENAKFLMETVYNLLQLDIMDKMQLQLSVQLLSNCCIESRLQAYKPVAKAVLLLNDYLKLLCTSTNTSNFQNVFSFCYERFKDFFDRNSKQLTNQSWFGDFLVLIFFMHSQLQNQSVFSCFWKQMNKPDCFKAMFKFFVELMKLAPCISAETKLFTISCCTSVRKHVILSFAQIALASFVFYCQNIKEEDEHQQAIENCDKQQTEYYKEEIQNNLVLIINHAFKIIDKMDCITSSSQEIEIILTRVKQVTLSCKSKRQAATCIAICELFLKIKTKISNKNWPLLLRRLYKTVSQLISDEPLLGRDLQMCYIASMLQNDLNLVDLNQIRTQISIFYANDTTIKTIEQQQPHDHCLMHLYQTTNSLLRPHLETSQRKLLHWLESQHILKYYKSNKPLLHSVLKSSLSHYDFVLITKLGKLQTYAMAKITSLHKNFNLKEKESTNLNRLEQLTFGHVCVMLLNDMSANQKFQIDSSNLCEEQLEKLLLHEEMSSITISNDLKRFKMAWKAFKAFENFYEMFDSEIISMDDAIIDWESLLDDLASLALCLQLSGYMDHCLQAWLLHYKCSRLIQDNISALRGLAFFCEHSEHFDTKSDNHDFKLEEEIQNNFPILTQGLENLANLQRQAYQSYILLAVLQIAHYYARTSRFSFAQMLIQHVQQKHAELSERQGRYDIVLATKDAIKFRLLWKHFDDAKATKEEKTRRIVAENLLLHRCLLHEVEETLDRLHEFSCLSSCDGVLYSILIINLVQELAECTVNRLCDSFINALFIATCKCTLLMGLALRFVQVMSMWMWVNLQMEYVDRAQVKLKIIEFVLGMKSLKELTKNCAKSTSEIQSSSLLPTACADILTPNHHQQGMEAIRKLAQVQLSPIKTDKLQLSPSHRNSELKRYLRSNIDTKSPQLNEQLEWIFFMVGCLNARLYFLVEDYDQLELFYEHGQKWLHMRQNCFNKKYYEHIELMATQHYANFLRAKHFYDKALKSLEYGIKLCENRNFYIDAVYSINFQLQLVATQKEMNTEKIIQHKVPNHSKLRRALQFNISPESQKTPCKSDVKEKKLKNVMASVKKSSVKIKPLLAPDIDCSSSKKIKTQTTSNACLDIKPSIPKPKFEICEDFIEIVEIIDNDAEIIAMQEDKSLKRTKLIVESEKLLKTPKTIRKTTKSAKTTCTKSSVKYKRPETIPQFKVDCLSSSSSQSSYVSTENLDVKENLNSNDLIVKMQSLEIKNDTEQILKSQKKPNIKKELADDIIVLEDSLCINERTPTKIENKPKSSRTRTTTKDKALNGQSTCEKISTTSSRPRRQRKLLLDNNTSPSICSTIDTPIVTRRRQKTLV